MWWHYCNGKQCTTRVGSSHSHSNGAYGDRRNSNVEGESASPGAISGVPGCQPYTGHILSSRPSTILSSCLPCYLLMRAMLSWYDQPQWTKHRRLTSLQHYASAYYISCSIPPSLDRRENNVCTPIKDRNSAVCILQNCFDKNGKNAPQARKIDWQKMYKLKLQYIQNLDHRSLWPFIYRKYYLKCRWTMTLWLLSSTAIQNSFLQFPSWELHLRI